MPEEGTKTASSSMSSAFILSTAQILASHQETASTPILNKSIEKVENTPQFEGLEGSHGPSRLEQLNHQNMTTAESITSIITDDTRKQVVEAASILELEDIRCHSCHTFKNKHDFNMEEREKHPESTCLPCVDPPTVDNPKIYFPGQRNPNPEYYGKARKEKKEKENESLQGRGWFGNRWWEGGGCE